MAERRSTGKPGLDAQNDFLRARRRATLGRLAGRLRGEPDDVGMVLPYEEVVQALGFRGEHRVGPRVVQLNAIVGTVDRGGKFDRKFRPISPELRSRWEHIAEAMRRGESMPPVDLIKLGEIYFVRDGHHRVSVSRALGRDDIDAVVTEVVTEVGTDGPIMLAQLPLKSHQRVFFERVPLPEEFQREIEISDPWDYAKLGEAVEAWGFRWMQDRGGVLDRPALAAAWLEHEYRPVVAMLREADLIGTGTATEAYMRLSAERYRLLRTHHWDDETLRRVVEGTAGAPKRRRK